MAPFSHRTATNGSVIVFIFVMSLFATIILASYLQFVSVNRQDNYNRHYEKIAQEAAESGLAYATSCFEKNSRMQTWGASATSAPAHLEPRRDCNGAIIGGASPYIVSTSTERSKFTVGNLQAKTANSAVFVAIGTAEQLDGAGNPIRTYTVEQRKAITWGAGFSQPVDILY